MIPKLKTTIPIQIQVKKENNRPNLVNTNQNGYINNNNVNKKIAINASNNKFITSLTNSNITSTTTTTMTAATSSVTSVNPSTSVKYNQVPTYSDNNNHKIVNKNVQNLSPIKPSFVNNKETEICGTQQIMHSTPTHNLARTIENFPLNQEKLKKYTSLVSEKDKGLKVGKKQKIVKELAINILELNGYRTRTEQLENQLKASYEHIKQNKSFRSSGENQSISEKTDGIQNELGKLKSEMLEKIRDIHNLEEELVKIEGQNNSTVKQLTSDFDMNGPTMLAHRSEEVMNEIKNILKGLVNMENSVYTNGDSMTTQNIVHTNNNSNSTFTQIYEEYHKISSSRSPSTSNSKRTININSLNQKDQLDIYQRIDKFKSQIEQNYNYILIQSNKLESYFAKSENVEKCLNELENFKNVIESTQDTLDREKLKLFKEMDNFISNPTITRNIRSEIEHSISNKYITYHDIIRNLYSFIPVISSPNQTNLISNNNNNNTNNHKDSDSSFLTEEEEAIKIISERIKVLKDRINQKQSLPKLSKKVRNRSSKNLNNSSSEDTDTKELLHLNEQIKLLKSRMIAKGNQLNKVRSNNNNNNNNNHHDETFDKPNPTICSSSTQQQATCSGPIYLPISHIKKRNIDSSSSPDNNIKYEIEPYNANKSLHENEITISKKTTNIYKCSPERKYMSSIEIPADQLEQLKRNAQRKTVPNSKLEPVVRSKSMYTKIINAHDNDIEEKKKRHKSANNVRFENQSTENSENEISKQSNHNKLQQHPEKETMTDNTQTINETFPAQEEIADLRQSLDKSHKEIEGLKSELNRKNEFFNKQLEEYKSKADLNSNEIQMNNKNNENLLKLIENQNMEILELKQKLNSELIMKKEKMKHRETPTESSDIDSIKNGKKGKLNKIEKGSTDSLANIRIIDSKKPLQNVNINKIYLTDACIQTNELIENTNVGLKESEIPIGPNLAEEPEVLMCNIPEHHSLEDMIHKNREEIANLKANLKTTASAHNFDTSFSNNRIYFDEIALLEKKAEFQALDLAINDKRKQLYNLELKKNRHLNDSCMNYNECSYSYLQDEVACIEQTLRKRIKEFNELEGNLYNGRKELNLIRESKMKLEKEYEYLKKKNAHLSKETNIFDKKANEATIELIATREELESLKKQRECLKNDIDSMKSELVNYVKSLKTTANSINQKNRLTIGDSEINELKQTIIEQRSLLESLNEEIYIKKKDIDLLRDQSANLNKQFKHQVQTFEKEIAQIRIKKEDVYKEFSQTKVKLEQINDELNSKSRLIQEKSNELESIEKTIVELNVKKQDCEKKLKSIDNELSDRKNELENLDENLNRYNQTLSQLRRNENEFVNELEKLNREIQNRKLQIEESKQCSEEINLKRIQMQEKLNSLNDEIQNLNNDCEKKEKELSKLNNALKEKQMTLRREKDDLNEINDEKNYIMQEMQDLKEKLRNNKHDFDKLEENKVSLEGKIKSIHIELKQLNQQYFEQQQKYEQTDDLIRQQEMKLTENNQKIANQQSVYEQLIFKCNEEKNELENVTGYLNDLKKEAQQEKLQLNNLKNQCANQKKILEDLNYRYEELQTEVDKKEGNAKENQELKNKLDLKIKQVNDLENKLAAKYQELEYMKEAFIELEKNIQEQINQSTKQYQQQQQQTHHIDLSELKSNHFSIEELISQCGTSKSSGSSNLQPKSLISSLLFTPKIKKSSSSFQTTTIMDDLSSSNTYTKNGCAYYQSPESAFSDEHTEFKERITKNFEENLSHLEKTKIQTKNLIENLKYNLNEIENITANNVFKLTANLNI